ncbi:hypothetical protein RRG08_027838 [Elysia crispata]|uniref:Uncharacterized protein n=1 Tax=Elysia crispata TaxID=231223 RepID=A0AAE1CUL8_9GAST|nr:hypothetical protein RRG08_027838 [Elysia crispata]
MTKSGPHCSNTDPFFLLGSLDCPSRDFKHKKKDMAEFRKSLSDRISVYLLSRVRNFESSEIGCLHHH